MKTGWLLEPVPRQNLPMNDREFRQHLVKLRLERERKEAQAENAALKKKPPATAKSQKAKKTRSA